MNEELALRTLAYLKTHYQTNSETLISKEDIEAIDFILNENEQLTNLINEYENKGYDIATERADFLLEIQDLQQELQRKDNEIKQLQEDIVNHIKIASEYKEQMIIKDNIIKEIKNLLEEYDIKMHLDDTIYIDEKFKKKIEEIISGK